MFQACEITFFTWFFWYIFNFNVPAPPGACSKPVNLLFLHNLFDIFSILMHPAYSGVSLKSVNLLFLQQLFLIFSILMYLRSLELFSSLLICFFYNNYLIYFQFQCTRAPWSMFPACKFAFFTTIISYIFKFNVPASSEASLDLYEV